MRFALAMVVAVAAGCGGGGPPTLATECRSDDDCTVVGMVARDGVCCDVCGPQPASRTSAAEFQAWCDEHPDNEQVCPVYRCADRGDDHAVCQAGRCVRAQPP